MKKQTLVKVLAAMLTMVMVVMFMQSSVFAMAGVVDSVNNAANTAITGSGDPESKITTMGGQIIRIMRIVGVIVAIAMLIYLAIKYISSSPNEKAEIKTSATHYVIGAVILFAASGILGIIEGFASNIG